MQHQRLKQQQQQALMQQALLQQQSLYHPGLLAPPQVLTFFLLRLHPLDFFHNLDLVIDFDLLVLSDDL